MTVKIQKPIKFNNNCNCIVDYDELDNEIIYEAKQITIYEEVI